MRRNGNRIIPSGAKKCFSTRRSPPCISLRRSTPLTPPTGGFRTVARPRRCCEALDWKLSRIRKKRPGSASLVRCREKDATYPTWNLPANLHRKERNRMVEAVMLWNEPNNLSHWDFHLDPDWSKFAAMTLAAVTAIRKVNPELKIVLGGISPIDPKFM